MTSVKSKCGWEDNIKIVCREAVQNIEKEHTGVQKGLFWKSNQFFASENVDTVLIGLVSVSFWINPLCQGFTD